MTTSAAQSDSSLAPLDTLDRALFDALSALVDSKGGAVFDPALEALRMRELARSWKAPIPPSVGLRVYREILGAALRKHAPVSLHVADSDRDVCEAARAHFGAAMPMTVYPTSSMVVQALAEDRHAIGIVPMPLGDERQPGWWSNLAAPNGTGPRVVAKLPFFRNDGSAVLYPPCYALASVPVTRTGDDTTLVVVFLRGDMSRQRLAQVLKIATLEAHIIAMGHDQPERAPSRFLIEASGFLSLNDQRLNAVRAHGGEEIADVAVVGAYANPVSFAGGSR